MFLEKRLAYKYGYIKDEKGRSVFRQLADDEQALNPWGNKKSTNTRIVKNQDGTYGYAKPTTSSAERARKLDESNYEQILNRGYGLKDSEKKFMMDNLRAGAGLSTSSSRGLNNQNLRGKSGELQSDANRKRLRSSLNTNKTIYDFKDNVKKSVDKRISSDLDNPPEMKLSKAEQAQLNRYLKADTKINEKSSGNSPSSTLASEYINKLYSGKGRTDRIPVGKGSTMTREKTPFEKYNDKLLQETGYSSYDELKVAVQSGEYTGRGANLSSDVMHTIRTIQRNMNLGDGESAKTPLYEKLQSQELTEANNLAEKQKFIQDATGLPDDSIESSVTAEDFQATFGGDYGTNLEDEKFLYEYEGRLKANFLNTPEGKEMQRRQEKEKKEAEEEKKRQLEHQQAIIDNERRHLGLQKVRSEAVVGGFGEEENKTLIEAFNAGSFEDHNEAIRRMNYSFQDLERNHNKILEQIRETSNYQTEQNFVNYLNRRRKQIDERVQNAKDYVNTLGEAGQLENMTDEQLLQLELSSGAMVGSLVAQKALWKRKNQLIEEAEKAAKDEDFLKQKKLEAEIAQIEAATAKSLADANKADKTEFTKAKESWDALTDAERNDPAIKELFRKMYNLDTKEGSKSSKIQAVEKAIELRAMGENDLADGILAAEGISAADADFINDLTGGGTSYTWQKPTNSTRRTDRHNNLIAFAVTSGGTNEFTKALDTAGIEWEYGDPFPNNPNMVTVSIKDPNKAIDAAKTVLANTGAIKNWYYNHTGKSILPKLGVTNAEEFKKLDPAKQEEVIKEIYQAEVGDGAFVKRPGSNASIIDKVVANAESVGDIEEALTNLGLGNLIPNGTEAFLTSKYGFDPSQELLPAQEVKAQNIANGSEKPYAETPDEVMARATWLRSQDIANYANTIEKVLSKENVRDFTVEELRYFNFTGMDGAKAYPQGITTEFEREAFDRKAEIFRQSFRKAMGKYDHFYDLFLTNAQMGHGYSDADIQRKIQPLFNAMLADDIPEIQRQLANVIIGERQDGSMGFDAWNNMTADANEVQRLLNEYGELGGDTNAMVGTIQSISKSLGLETLYTGEEWQSMMEQETRGMSESDKTKHINKREAQLRSKATQLRNRLGFLQDKYRIALTGAAANEEELKQIENKIGTTFNTEGLLSQQLTDLMDSAMIQRDEPLRLRLRDSYQAVMGTEEDFRAYMKKQIVDKAVQANTSERSGKASPTKEPWWNQYLEQFIGSISTDYPVTAEDISQFRKK